MRKILPPCLRDAQRQRKSATPPSMKASGRQGTVISFFKGKDRGEIGLKRQEKSKFSKS